jgi:proteasome accessory factor C
MATAAADRVERILSVLPWVAQSPGVTVAELAERFGMDEATLRDDLSLVFVEVGVHPFTPDTMIDVLYDGDRVSVHLGEYFRRPLRLTHDEGLRLLASARAVQEGPFPDDLLDGAISKLAAALGAGDAVEVRLGDADPDVLRLLGEAVTARRRVRLDYVSFGRDERSDRAVDPWRLVPHEGHWYLQAWCHDAAGERMFRVDRVHDAEVLDESVSTTPPPGDGTDWDLGGGRRVELLLPPETAWVAEEYPATDVEPLDDGRIRVVLAVGAAAWLERLLLRLGPHVEGTDLDSGDPLAPVAAGAAHRILRQYR